MIVHSTQNQLDGTCVVRVEGIDPNASEARVKQFAVGAAAKHNIGYYAYAKRVTWCDDTGAPIEDSASATVAIVACEVVAP